MKTKLCNVCGETKPLSEYYARNRNTEGRQTTYYGKCKECEKAYQRKRYRKHGRRQNTPPPERMRHRPSPEEEDEDEYAPY